MTWTANGARANGHAKLEQMGIGGNAAARIDRDHSPCNAAVDKVRAELRQEVVVREQLRLELDFLEKGGDPLEFKFEDVILPSHFSTAILDLLSDSDPKRLILLQSRQNGTDQRKLSENLKTATGVHVITRDGLGAVSTNALLSRLPRNCLKSSTGTPKNIISVTTEDSADSEVGTRVQSVQAEVDEQKDEKAELSSSDIPGREKSNSSQLTEVVEEAKISNAEPANEANIQLTSATPQKNKPVPQAEPVSAQPDSTAQVQNDVPIMKNDDQLLQKAQFIEATRKLAATDPLRGCGRKKSQWDFVLEEMAWMANDFMQERLWKQAAAAQVSRWTAEAVARNSTSDMETMPTEATKKGQVEEELCGTSPTQNVRGPATPDCQDRFSQFSEERLVFSVPSWAYERHRKIVEDDWAATVSLYERELEKQNRDSESEAEEEYIGTQKKRLESDDFVKTTLKRRMPPNRPRSEKMSDFIVEDDEDFGPPKRKKLKILKKVVANTDSENEWLPESCSSPEKVQIKRKKEPFTGTKARGDDASGFKRVRLHKATEDRARRTSLRKADFLHVSINQPGDGVPWSTVEDQIVLALEHDFGPNWEFLCDAVNTNHYAKGHFRSVADCKKRHELIYENLQFIRTDQPTIPKGSAMFLLQRMQGPVEEDTLRLRFEHITKIRKRHSQNLQPEHGLPHSSHSATNSDILDAQGGRFLTPLDFPPDGEVTASKVPEQPEQMEPGRSGSRDEAPDVKPPKGLPKASTSKVAQRSGNAQEQCQERSEDKMNHQNRVQAAASTSIGPDQKPMNFAARPGPQGRRPMSGQQPRPLDPRLDPNFQHSRYPSPRFPMHHWRPGQQLGPGVGYRPHADYQHFQGGPRPNARQMLQMQRPQPPHQQQQQPQPGVPFVPRSYQSFSGPRPHFRQMYSSKPWQGGFCPPPENRRPVSNIPPVEIVDTAGGASSNCK